MLFLPSSLYIFTIIIIIIPFWIVVKTMRSSTRSRNADPHAHATITKQRNRNNVFLKEGGKNKRNWQSYNYTNSAVDSRALTEVFFLAFFFCCLRFHILVLPFGFAWVRHACFILCPQGCAGKGALSMGMYEREREKLTLHDNDRYKNYKAARERRTGLLFSSFPSSNANSINNKLKEAGR